MKDSALVKKFIDCYKAGVHLIIMPVKRRNKLQLYRHHIFMLFLPDCDMEAALFDFIFYIYLLLLSHITKYLSQNMAKFFF